MLSYTCEFSVLATMADILEIEEASKLAVLVRAKTALGSHAPVLGLIIKNPIFILYLKSKYMIKSVK